MHEACLVHHLQRLKRQRVGYEELMMVHDWRPLEQLGFSRPESQRLLAALEKARGPQDPSPPLAQACASLPYSTSLNLPRLAGRTDPPLDSRFPGRPSAPFKSPEVRKSGPFTKGLLEGSDVGNPTEQENCAHLPNVTHLPPAD